MASREKPQANNLRQISVSVVIPAYNSERFLDCALSSVSRQTFPVLETIVVDDGSTDRTRELASSHRCAPRIVVRPARAGAALARNDGVARSQGTHIAFLDADDYWADDKVEHQVRAFADDPLLAMATGTISEFYDSELPSADRSAMQLRRRPAGIPSTIMIARDAFATVGGFAAEHGMGADSIEWGIAVRESGIRTTSVVAAVSYRRLHDANASRVMRAEQHHAYLTALKASLDRRRK